MNSANRILGTLGRRGWRLKRAWALSRARDWWRAESSRRLTLGSMWAGCEEADEGTAELGLAVPAVKGSPVRPAEAERLAEVVHLPAAAEPVEDEDAAGDGERRPEEA